jgi:hypothetical protein
MRNRETVIREVYVAFEDGREVWYVESAYTRNDDIVIGSESEVRAFVCARHGFDVFPSNWALVRIPNVETFKEWFGIL